MTRQMHRVAAAFHLSFSFFKKIKNKSETPVNLLFVVHFCSCYIMENLPMSVGTICILFFMALTLESVCLSGWRERLAIESSCERL